MMSLFFSVPKWILLLLTTCSAVPLFGAGVKVGVDVLFESHYSSLLEGRKVGIITNHTAINGDMKHTVEVFKKQSDPVGFSVTALFAPEHGISGSSHADETIKDGKGKEGIPIFSLHGKTKRPTPEMLANVDTLVFDIQDIGSRSYTYITTLFYAMEEAAKSNIRMIVLDRPNPINGTTVDGPMLQPRWRSFVGYINVPYCHGMTVGELARFFNAEYKIGCRLHVVPMKGWDRKMTFEETGLAWIPTSPHIPEASSVWYYPATGILGELQIVSIGVGYPLPFKLVGAPWIDADAFAKHLNDQKFPGVRFQPFHFKPFYGKFSKNECHGVLIVITDRDAFQPVGTQYLIIGALKNLYPEKFQEGIKRMSKRKEMFCKVNGTDEIWRLMNEEKYLIWKLKAVDQKSREKFLSLRKKYLIADYSRTPS